MADGVGVGPMLQAHALVKTFPTLTGPAKVVVDHVSFTVQAGEVFGLLGPNGAGKTTTLRLLAGLLEPTDGTAILNGADVSQQRHHARRWLGYLTASTGLYQRLTPRETLVYFGQLHGLSRQELDQRVSQLTQWLGMDSFLDVRCGTLSTGQRQRASIARALVADPPILILDEPTLGLDVLTNRVIHDLIRVERARGKAIILSTHHLDEAELLCDRFGLMHDGRLIADATLDELRSRVGRHRLTDIFLALCEGPGDAAMPGLWAPSTLPAAVGVGPAEPSLDPHPPLRPAEVAAHLASALPAGPLPGDSA